MLEQQTDINKDKKRKYPTKQNTAGSYSVEECSSSGRASSTGSGKLKRKDQHPVRKEFVQIGETQYKCNHCEWTTVLNATRMVKHIVEQCQQVPPLVQDEIATIQHVTIQKEQNSPFVVENKKDIHGLFEVKDNKRSCLFCQWTTVRNLTRMRNHIMSQCTEIPVHILSTFMKKEHSENALEEDTVEIVQQDDSESYQVYTLEDGQWNESGIEPLDYDCEDVEEPQLDDNYLELQEIDVHNCNYCGKSLTYNSGSIETESEIFCSDQCLKRQEKTNQIAEQLSNLEKSKQVANKRSIREVDEPKDEIPAKQIKFVVVSNNTSPQTIRNKQTVHARRTEVSSSASAPVGVSNYSVEQYDSSTVPEEAPASPNTSVRIVKKTPTKTVVSPKNDPPSVPSRSESALKSTLNSKLTAATDEGSCHSFAGGHVYPQEDVHSADHKLQWTKAVISRPAPHFEATAVVEGAFKKIKLSDYLGKYLVFFFYPLDFTFVCPTEILAFSDRVKEFQKLNAEVIAASIDSHFTHLAWINTPRKEGGLGKINIPLVSDITHSIAKDYGVYLDDLGHTLRGLFIIDDRGILRQITMNDLPVGRSVDETLRLVQAFQYTDKHGEVCPAGWKPGQDTIVPNPEEKMKYFEKNHKY